VQGWVRIFSYTRPRENIIAYQPWFIKSGEGNWTEQTLANGRRHGKGVIAQLTDCTDRDAAHALIGNEIAVQREQLPEAAVGEYYWSDLIGLQVINTQDEKLGTVDHLLETGANDVLVLKGDQERLIPFVMEQVVLQVDLEKGVIRVDWDKEF
jgi:16S rRNA processing protein RimM